MTNRLSGEKSPYLQQHAENPVDWYPWGPEALQRARDEDRLILVSIGYSACHWCHVMAHESFNDPQVAASMNDNFVNIKVDREERPDVDALYMEAVQAMRGQGGWPLNVFLTPDGRAFFGGTYFPPEGRHGIPSWTQVLESVAAAYRDRRADVLTGADSVMQYLKVAQEPRAGEHDPTEETVRHAFEAACRQFDYGRGGFGAAPKFPQPLALDFVFRMSQRFHDDGARDFVLHSLRQMAAGGIFDQLGGGFHRYSVDGEWLVPHFEKMLYDNALLARVYTHAFQITGERLYRDIAVRTLDYLRRDLISSVGAFYAAEDADSGGIEGAFYVWTTKEVDALLDPALADLAKRRFGITASGNFEGKVILTTAAPIEELASEAAEPVDVIESRLAEIVTTLLAARSERIPPAKDTKILAGWNALAIRAFAEAGAVFGEAQYRDVAEHAMSFALTAMRPNGVLIRSYLDGPSNVVGFFEDHAYLLEALLTLYETTHQLGYFHEAKNCAETMIRLFWDDSKQAFFDTDGHGQLVVRPRSLFVNPIPSGNSSAAMGLLRLYGLTGTEEYLSRATAVLRSGEALYAQAPLAVPYLLSALDFELTGATQVALVAGPEDDTAGFEEAMYLGYHPNMVVAVGVADEPPLLKGRDLVDGRPAAYVCHQFACKLPVTNPEALSRLLAND